MNRVSALRAVTCLSCSCREGMGSSAYWHMTESVGRVELVAAADTDDTIRTA